MTASSESEVDPGLLDAAENALAYASQMPNAARLDLPDYVLIDNLKPHPTFGSVQRLRLSDDGVETAVRDVRAWFRARGRERFTWWVGSSATPPDLVSRLEEHGIEPYEDDPVVAVMVLDKPPPVVDSVETRRVETHQDFVTYLEIQADVFRYDEEVRRRMPSNTQEKWDGITAAGVGIHFLASIDGKPVASAFMVHTDRDLALLLGGATSPEARGRGAYRALVRSRWDTAVATGAKALVTHAGADSLPILSRLGFREISKISILTDRA